jgi:hypothetical protein
VSQVALTLVLLFGAGLLIRSLIAALSMNTWPGARSVVMADFVLPRDTYTNQSATAFFRELGNYLRGQSEIALVGLSLGEQTGPPWLVVDGQKRSLPGPVAFAGIDDQYLSTLGMEVVRGRAFTTSDDASAPPVAIVSESLARSLMVDSSVLGHVVTDPRGQSSVGLQIIGVVSDVVLNLAAVEAFTVYTPIAQQPAGSFNPQRRTVWIRARDRPTPAVRQARAVVARLEPRSEPLNLKTLDETLAEQMRPQHFGATVLVGLGGIAVFLTMLGVYGLADWTTALRRREMALRSALGASQRDVVGMICSEVVRWVLLGICVGLLLVWFGSGL